jgi:hypothetical protein
MKNKARLLPIVRDAEEAEVRLSGKSVGVKLA